MCWPKAKPREPQFACRQPWGSGFAEVEIQAVRPISACTKILDFRGFDSSRILNLMGGIRMSIKNSPEIQSQQILPGIILAGRLGVPLHQHLANLLFQTAQLFIILSIFSLFNLFVNNLILTMHIICMYVYIYIYTSIYLSLSLSIHIYIYI